MKTTSHLVSVQIVDGKVHITIRHENRATILAAIEEALAYGRSEMAVSHRVHPKDPSAVVFFSSALKIASTSALESLTEEPQDLASAVNED